MFLEKKNIESYFFFMFHYFIHSFVFVFEKKTLFKIIQPLNPLAIKVDVFRTMITLVTGLG